MYEIEIDREHRRVVTVWGDSVTDESVLAYQREVWSDNSLMGFSELIDFRGAGDPEVTSAGLKALAKEALAMNGDVGFGKTAIVVRDPFTFGMARMYEALRTTQEGNRRQIKVFTDWDAAMEWLREKGG